VTVEELVKLFEGSASPLSTSGAERLLEYLDRLRHWSERINLTGLRTAGDTADRLLFDATEIAPLIPLDSQVLDIGAGAGGLAVTLLVLRPDLVVRAVEPRQKRATFLRKVRRELELTDLEVLQTRAEDLLDGSHEPADAAYAQAVMPPRKWLPLGAKLVRKSGAVLCLTAAALEEAVVPTDLQEVTRSDYRLPISGAPRTVTLLRSTSPSSMNDS